MPVVANLIYLDEAAFSPEHVFEIRRAVMMAGLTRSSAGSSLSYGLLLSGAFTFSVISAPQAFGHIHGNLGKTQSYVAEPMPCVPSGDTGRSDPLLRQIETILIELGWVLDAPDGVADAQTASAISIWKRQNGFGEQRMSCHDLLTHLRAELAGAPIPAERTADLDSLPAGEWAAPSNLTVSNRSPGGNGATVSVTWHDNSTAEDGFEIEMSTDLSSWASAATVWNNAAMPSTETGERNRILRNQPPTGTLCYRVSAIRRADAASEPGSAPSEPICADGFRPTQSGPDSEVVELRSVLERVIRDGDEVRNVVFQGREFHISVPSVRWRRENTAARVWGQVTMTRPDTIHYHYLVELDAEGRLIHFEERLLDDVALLVTSNGEGRSIRGPIYLRWDGEDALRIGDRINPDENLIRDQPREIALVFALIAHEGLSRRDFRRR